MSNFSMIKFKKENRTGEITLNRPEKRNALHPDMVGEIKVAVRDCMDDPVVKIIVLRGAGDAFCAGADLSVIKAMQNATYQENLSDSRHLAELFDLIYQCPKPVIAAVHGHAIAGGCGLAAVCDIVIASEAAKFGYTETRIGFVPAIVARFLIRKTGETHAKNLLLTGSLISARRAAEIGLVSEVFPAETFEEETEQIIQTLLEKNSGEAMQATKTLINTVSGLSHDDALAYAVELNAKSRGTDDCKKGISAFLNKEKITW